MSACARGRSCRMVKGPVVTRARKHACVDVAIVQEARRDRGPVGRRPVIEWLLCTQLTGMLSPDFDQDARLCTPRSACLDCRCLLTAREPIGKAT